MNARRLNIWESAKALLDDVNVRKGRDLTADESSQFQAMMDDISRIDAERDALLRAMKPPARSGSSMRKRRVRGGMRPTRTATRTSGRRKRSPISVGRSARGRINALQFDLTPGRNLVEAVRAGADGTQLRLVTGDTGSSGGSLTVPALTSSTIYAYMTASVAKGYGVARLRKSGARYVGKV